MKKAEFNPFVSLGVTESLKDKMGRGMPNPFANSLEACAIYWQERERLMYELAGDLGLGQENPSLEYFIPQYDGRIIIATEYGAKNLQWDDENNSFWLDKGGLWANLSSVKEIENIPLPVWEKNPLMQAGIKAFEEVQAKFGKDYARNCGMGGWTELQLNQPKEKKTYKFIHLPSFVDLGGYLLGEVEFLTLLAAEPELANALLKKCFLISLSYAKFCSRIYERPIQGWGSMAGDNSCLLSTDMYRQYAMAFDAMARQAFGNLPRNLHSCGASRQLYKIWSDYPEREQIIFLQTRALVGDISQIRKSLPNTFIQLTMYLPEIDLTRETQENIKNYVAQWAEGLGYQNFSIGAMASTLNDQVRENFYAINEVMNRLVKVENRR